MKVSKTKQGEFISMTDYMVVENVDSKTNTINVRNIDGQKFTIQGKPLIEGGKLVSASQFEKEEKVSRTELIERVKNTNGVAFTVNFDKADGSNRTMVCHYLYPETELGRSYVKDLEETNVKVIHKQVDHRTLHWAIINGTKYTVKK